MTAFALHDPQDLRALYSAVWRHNPAKPSTKFNELLDKGLPVNHRYANGRTLVHVAAWFNHADLLVELAKRQAQMDVMDELGSTPLLLAIQNKSFAAFKVLVAQQRLVAKAKAPTSSEDPSSEPSSSKPSSSKVAQSILVCPVEEGSLQGTTPAHELCRLGLVDWLSYAKQQNVLSDLSVRNAQGDTLAHVASKAQQYKVLSWLIHQGIDLSLSNAEGVSIKDLPRNGPSKKKGMKKELIHSDLTPVLSSPSP